MDPPAPHREVWISEHEASDDVRPAGDRLDRHGPHVLADPVVLPVVQDRARREDGAELLKTELMPGREPSVLAQLEVRGAGPEDGHLLLGHNAPQRLRALEWPV